MKNKKRDQLLRFNKQLGDSQYGDSTELKMRVNNTHQNDLLGGINDSKRIMQPEGDVVGDFRKTNYLNYGKDEEINIESPCFDVMNQVTIDDSNQYNGNNNSEGEWDAYRNNSCLDNYSEKQENELGVKAMEKTPYSISNSDTGFQNEALVMEGPIPTVRKDTEGDAERDTEETNDRYEIEQFNHKNRKNKDENIMMFSQVNVGNNKDTCESIKNSFSHNEKNDNTGNEYSSQDLRDDSSNAIQTNDTDFKSPNDSVKQIFDDHFALDDVLPHSDKNENVVREIKKRYVIGDLAGTFYQTPFYSKKSDDLAFHRNDIIADIAKMGNLLVMGASLRGESHYARRIPRQDSFLIEECSVGGKKYVIAAIADGVGNANKADEFSEMLVNFLCYEISKTLRNIKDINLIDWNIISDSIWKTAIKYCYQKSGSRNLDDYFENWASTLECIVIESSAPSHNEYVVVSFCGDGGVYLIDEKREWHAIKHGKVRRDSSISNTVFCLPDRPVGIIKRKGELNLNESLFIVTDGIGDYLEAYEDVRKFFTSAIPEHANLPEYIRVLNVAIKQMDDDKTGIVIKQYSPLD